MRPIFICLLFLVMATCCKDTIKSQSQEAYFRYKVDSLDNVQPQAFRKIKPDGRTYLIHVKNQQQFDAINDEISKAIMIGNKNVKVKIESGVYHFRENHIQRKNDQTDVFVSIIGQDAVLTSNKDYGKEAEQINPWLEMVYADTLIKVVDTEKKLCMIPYANSLDNDEKENLARVQITQWFRAPVYTVSHIDEKGIYFVAPDLKWENGYGGRKGYNVNFDYLYRGKTPRFRLYDKTKERDCAASRFINLENSSYKSFCVAGLCFKDNKSGNALISMTNVEARQIIVSDCTFEQIQSTIANVSGTNNVVFTHNAVRNTMGDEVRFLNNCVNVRVTDNMFVNCGQGIGNTFCVNCRESEYYVAGNTFRDFGYGAIGVGVWHGFTKQYSSKGIVENNELFYSPEYFVECWKYTVMDSGAIYTWTQNDDVIIRYNYIHDYEGAGDNRGIFCDDGASNLKIYGNIVLNTPNSYSIDSRYIKDQKSILRNNTNNFMAYNMVDNSIRFMGYKEENRHCVKGQNFILYPKETNQELIYDNLELQDDDIIIVSGSATSQKNSLSKEDCKIIKQNPCFKKVYQYLKESQKLCMHQ